MYAADLFSSDDYDWEKEQDVSLTIPPNQASAAPKAPLVLKISKNGEIIMNPDVYPEIVERSGGGSHLRVLEDRINLLVEAMSGELLG